jgi:hypothetical protein
MKKKIWVNKARSFKEAERFDRKYYLSISASERLGAMQFLREIYRSIKKGARNAGRTRLQRVIRIVQ